MVLSCVGVYLRHMNIGSYFRLEGVLVAGAVSLYVQARNGALWEVGWLKNVAIFCKPVLPSKASALAPKQSRSTGLKLSSPSEGHSAQQTCRCWREPRHLIDSGAILDATNIRFLGQATAGTDGSAIPQLVDGRIHPLERVARCFPDGHSMSDTGPCCR